MRKASILASLTCNLLNLILVAVCVARFFIASGDGNMEVTGWSGFIFFTVDSNVLSALASAAVSAWLLSHLRQKPLRLPRWLLSLKLAGASAVALTLLTVLAFLGQIYGYAAMFEGANLFLHLLCPLLSIFSLVLFERGEKPPFSSTLFGALPAALYGVVYGLCVLVWKCWTDFYGFNLGGRWYITAPAVVGTAWLLSIGLWSLVRLRNK